MSAQDVSKKMFFIGGQYLDSAALPLAPGVEVTVDRVEKAQVQRPGSKPEEKWILHLTELPGFPMILSAKTNRKMMIARLGDDPAIWKGKKIFIYRDPDVRFGPKIVGGIRIGGGR